MRSIAVVADRHMLLSACFPLHYVCLSMERNRPFDQVTQRGTDMAGCILKLFDRKRICFSARDTGDLPEVFITYVDQDTLSLMLGMEVTDGGLARSLKHRKIPESRAQIHSFSVKGQVYANSTMTIIRGQLGALNAAGASRKNSQKALSSLISATTGSVMSWPAWPLSAMEVLYP